MTGGLSVLNTGAGDLEVTFNQHDSAERAKAIRMLTDMQARGYAILVRLEDGTYARATSIDATRGRYILQLPEDAVASAGADAIVEPTLKRRRGRPPGCGKKSGTVTVSTPIEGRYATGVARSAGG